MNEDLIETQLPNNHELSEINIKNIKKKIKNLFLHKLNFFLSNEKSKNNIDTNNIKH